ncbi:SDR family oxidoreductase [Chromobacterium sp. S0633]|uniref:SDR family NAD(P)-dependent oxidoreductase n=1 Tax=Chromobacterium sp. S0633 TaxID=2957805 RepID=UPI0020A0A16A|nr:SDR family oxidoreductase [Chromobacterium sp. S0633]MCP1292253.1 SDR family oxidoreductase [Chromobacterium sp. S0633]
MSLRDKTIVITGAGSGIGAACARRFAAEGARLALVGRRAGPLLALAEETGGLALAGDAADAAAWEDFLARIRARWGRVDGLAACAGGLGMGAALDTDDAAWRAAMRANLDTAFVSARACLPDLIRQGGSMVLLASIAGLAAGPAACGYVTAKHALLGLARSLARDYGPAVRVNALCPGWVRTPMADEEMLPLMAAYGEDLDAAYRRVTADVPLRRPATPEDIAAVCRFLLSDEAAMVSGACLTADGGATAVDVPTLAYSRLERD